MSKFEALKKVLRDDPALFAGLGLSTVGAGLTIDNLADNDTSKESNMLSNSLMGAGVGLNLSSIKSRDQRFEDQANFYRLMNNADMAGKGMHFEKPTDADREFAKKLGATRKVTPASGIDDFDWRKLSGANKREILSALVGAGVGAGYGYLIGD